MLSMKTLFLLISFFLLANLARCQESSNYSQTAFIETNLDSLYEANASKLKLDGTCPIVGKTYVKHVVLKNGEVKNLEIIKSLKNCPKADSIALELVQLVKYVPAIKKGEKTEVVKVIAVPFHQ